MTSDFDDGCRDEDVNFVARELRHHRIFFARLHAAVQESDFVVGKYVFLQAFLFGFGAFCLERV